MNLPRARSVVDWGSSLVSGQHLLRSAAQKRSERLALLLSKAGVVGNPYSICARTLFNSLLALAVASPSAVILSVYVWPPLLLLALSPAVVYLAPELILKDRVSQRREGVDRELPFFSILVNVLGSAGVSLYSVLIGTIGSKSFPCIRKEALLVKRDVEVFGSDPNEALDRLGSSHPSRRFGTFLGGYTSKVRSGGDIPAYLTGESGFLLRGLEEDWSRYASRAGTVGSTMVTVFGLLPLLIMIVGVFSSGASVTGLIYFTALGVPFFTVLLVYMAGRMQPVGELGPSGNLLYGLGAAAVGVAVSVLAGQVWITVATGLFLFLFVYGLSVGKEIRITREVDEALPEFLKDLLEFKRQEYDLTKSLLNISSHNRYNPTFDAIVSKVALQLKAGTPIDELKIDPKTRLGRLVFLVLGQMGHSGGGTVDTVYQLCAYTSKAVEMKRNTMAEMKPYIILSYVSPILLAFGVAFVSGVLRSYASQATPGESALRLTGFSGAMTPLVSEASSILIVVSAAALGIIAAKMTDFTVRNTLRPCLNVLVAVAAILVLSSVGLQSLHILP